MYNATLPEKAVPTAPNLTNHHAHPTARAIIRGKDFRSITGIPNSTRADKENPKSKRYDPTFPKKIHLGPRSVGYFLDEVMAWLDSRRKA